VRRAVDLLARRVRLLPNTAGCQTAKDAVLTTEFAREALASNWVKLEAIGGRELLYPVYAAEPSDPSEAISWW
jgi:thiazole synthase